MDMPNLLCHYTDLAGLLGIVQCKEIWCSSIRFLNDDKEYVHGLDAIARSFRESTTEIGTASPELRAFVRAGLIDMIEGLANAPRGRGPCVASLTTLSDDLSQWRGYGGTPGVCIRFDGKRLGEQASRSGASVLPCFYRERDLLGMIETANDVAKSQPLAAMTTNVDAFTNAINGGIDELLNFCHKATCLFKAEAFSAEYEWRILTISGDRIQFRCRGRVIVPYVPIELWSDASECPIREIGIGPGDHQTLNMCAVRTLLEAHGLQDVLVNASAVPLRKFD